MTDAVTSPSVTQLLEALAQLPNTPEAIADYLYVRGCYGNSGFYTCPLAVWLKRVLQSEVCVGHRVVSMDEENPLNHRNVDLPDHISRFVKEHDEGKFIFLRPLGEWVR